MIVKCGECGLILSYIRESNEEKIVEKEAKCLHCGHRWIFDFPTASKHQFNKDAVHGNLQIVDLFADTS